MTVMVIGRLVFDVEVKEVGQDKKKVINNRLAVNAGKDKTVFVDITAWSGTADIIGKFKKGNELSVVGTLINHSKKTKKNDVEFEYETVGILVDHVEFTHGNLKEQDN